MKYRPEVLQAALSVRQAEENIGIANAGNMPSVSIGAGNDWSDEDFPGSGNSAWRVTGGITFSFFDGGATTPALNKPSRPCWLPVKRNSRPAKPFSWPLSRLT